jgi:regulator of nonsense transcripts 3
LYYLKLTSSISPAKPSRPARAYVHVLSEEIIGSLSEKVRATSFHDARNSSTDPALLGPPSVEFAPYARVPGNRSRKDGRQGTIDQDPEFVAFLESLTNPITKPTPVEGEAEKKDEEEVTTTPLVQFIKEKKASKAKESASGKSSKRGAKEKETKTEKVESKKLLKRPDRETAAVSAPTSPEKKPTVAKVEKATKEAVKAATKQASATKTKQASAKEATQTPETSSTERKRERGDARAAAMILQRDLGLAPSGGRRRGKAAPATTEGDRTKAEEAKQDSVPSTPTIPTGPKASRASSKATKDTASKATASKATATKANTTTTATPTEPSTAATTTESAVPATAPRAPKAAKQQKPKQPAVSSTATQAFLKHANPSQGVTEELLDTAFSAFGKVIKVEIDKKKGFGYVDFAEADGLQKAIAASPVTVAQSQVVVLERKNPPAQQAKAAAKTVETSSQASPAVPSPQQQPGGGTQKRSRGPRSRGGRGKGKAAGEGGNAGKPETGGTSET